MIQDKQSAQISQKQDERYIYIYIYIYIYTHALGHMMYSYKLLVPMNQRVLKKPSKESNKSGNKSSTTHRVLKSHRSKMGVIYIYITMKTMCPPSIAWFVEHFLVHWYQQRGTVHHVLKCMICHKAIVAITGKVYCFQDSIYITPILCL